VTGPLIQPNLHAVLVHYPIALLTLGVFIELFGFLWRRSGVRTAGHWMIVLGTLACIPAVTTGLYALRQTAAPGVMDGTWYSVVAQSDWKPDHWEVLSDHLSLMISASIVLLIAIIVWLGSADQARSRIYLLGMAILLVCVVLMVIGAHQGGDLVYKHATAVNLKTPPPIDASATWPRRLAVLIDPVELHLALVGLALALIATSLGLSVRRSAIAWENQMAETKATAAGLKPAADRGDANFLNIPMIYPARFWVLSGFVTLLAAAAGLWIIGKWSPGVLLHHLSLERHADHWRTVLHANTAAALVLLILLLALMMRWFPRRRFVMGMITTLLVLGVALQVWTGVLMLFDDSDGSLMHFTQPPVTQAASGMPAAQSPPPSTTTTVPVR
jgi:uncharacterized membrane protein